MTVINISDYLLKKTVGHKRLYISFSRISPRKFYIQLDMN